MSHFPLSIPGSVSRSVEGQEEFARRVPVDFQGVRLFVASAEDMVIV
jgi:hypothetical protein